MSEDETERGRAAVLLGEVSWLSFRLPSAELHQVEGTSLDAGHCNGSSLSKCSAKSGAPCSLPVC